MSDGDGVVEEIDITDNVGASSGAGDIPSCGGDAPVAPPSPVAGGGANNSSTNPQVAVVRQFLAGVGVPVPDTVTTLAQLQALASEYFRGGGGGGNSDGYFSGMGGNLSLTWGLDSCGSP
ncbi:hypothetical protein BWQ96_05282 [Gracilariopsis chorda]|uniref:Uncharacterized protein n=1 Tax=Gracilariopsis chorda TaxID=448386 RepID=A0A2V3IS16_9FLOR|nr:hypothetical protein BWQ96_05282 [Gracilariopsis chorda]|eukprot:PXF44918.1 hypothetical protein BWQ96_05282 [Gracilariopsis chorda]